MPVSVIAFACSFSAVIMIELQSVCSTAIASTTAKRSSARERKYDVRRRTLAISKIPIAQSVRTPNGRQQTKFVNTGFEVRIVVCAPDDNMKISYHSGGLRNGRSTGAHGKYTGIPVDLVRRLRTPKTFGSRFVFGDGGSFFLFLHFQRKPNIIA